MDIQKKLLQLFRKNRNILLTGGGGVGKTYTLNNLISKSRKKVVFTATTGLAASHLPDGQTIHKFLGFGTMNDPDSVHQLINSDSWVHIRERVRKTTVIVIDEVSMLSGAQLQLIDNILKYATNKVGVPFGGKQMLFVGDFLQIPPVVTKRDKARFEKLNIPVWCFLSKTWLDADVATIHLTEVKRQNDIKFINALNEIRMGECSDESFNLIKSTEQNKFPEGVEPVKLFAINKKVDAYNTARLFQLETEEFTNDASIKYRNVNIKYMMLDTINLQESLYLKVGCQVIITTNGCYSNKWKVVDGKIKYFNNEFYIPYHNGSMGIFLDVVPYQSEMLLTCERTGRKIRKIVNMGDNEVPRLGRNQKLLKIKLVENGEIVYIPQMDIEYECPLPEFKYTNPHYDISEKDHKVFERMDGRFTQFPVKVAYALSMHKSQGMSIDFVECNFKRVFAPGQSYVALSRARSLEGLRVKGFMRKHVFADEDAVNFYRQLEVEND